MKLTILLIALNAVQILSLELNTAEEYINSDDYRADSPLNSVAGTIYTFLTAIEQHLWS